MLACMTVGVVEMDILSLAELREADPATLVFAPLGLAMSGRLQPETALEFQQQTIAGANLAADVPEGVRSSFERLRKMHAYGVLCYDLFSVVDDLCWVVLEQALRARFIEFYDGEIQLSGGGRVTTLVVSDFDAVATAFRPGGSHYRKGWRLVLSSAAAPIGVPLTLGPLLRWARAEGLLHGQRNRVREGDLFERMRNNFAHGSGFKIAMPTESAGSIRELAELINRMWGHLTPGGQLYPAPIQREVMAVGWADDKYGARTVVMPADGLETFDERGTWTFIVLKGVPQDALANFDARYELTNYPADLLWGPGAREAGVQWLADATPEPDETTYLDRLFAVRLHADKTFLPNRPEVLRSIPEDRRPGTWHLVRADHPMAAFAHVKHLGEGIECRLAGQSRGGCPVEDILVGDWTEVFG